jgi:hypothetical protein
MGTFMKWVEEYEAQMGQNPTPASAEVQRSRLQPQVGTENIAKNAQDIDALLAIDSKVQHFDADIKNALKDDSESVQQFKTLWGDLSSKWKEFKAKKESQANHTDYGLGSNGGDPNYVQSMGEHPNMTPPQDQIQPGPGTFGNS